MDRKKLFAKTHFVMDREERLSRRREYDRARRARETVEQREVRLRQHGKRQGINQQVQVSSPHNDATFF